jgi:heptosyltransferase-1
MRPMRILLVKTSSLGDVVHNLPVASDLRARFPDARIDWVVEEAFAEIPRLHPAVGEVIHVTLRRWRAGLLRRGTWRAIAALRAQLRANRYDVVIDNQGLLKSALVAQLAGGTRIGLDWVSSREPLRPLYDRTLRVPWGQHAVERNRQLAAQALGYVLDVPPHYGIAAPSLLASLSWAAPLREHPYAVLLHATSAAEKLWPEQRWMELTAHLQQRGLACVLPWGSTTEQARSQRIAASLKHALVPPRLSLTDAAAVLATARIVFGLDTGLSHLAAALGAATVGIYVATDPDATGLYGAPRVRNVGGPGAAPAVADVIRAQREMLDLVKPTA